jgi:hypothetical protein
MSENETSMKLIEQIRVLAGELGIHEKADWPGAIDSDEYDYQVRCGLSTATVEILDFSPGAICQYFRYLLAGFVDPDNDRVASLLDALIAEIYQQLDSEEDGEKE